MDFREMIDYGIGCQESGKMWLLSLKLKLLMPKMLKTQKVVKKTSRPGGTKLTTS